MSVEQAVDFAFQVIKEVKVQLIQTGLGGHPEQIYRACKKLSEKLKLDMDTVVEIFELV